MNKFYTKLQTSWDWRAAGNFILGGTGSALLFMLTLKYFYTTPPLSFWLLALLLIAVGLFSVWLEIGKPWRFLHVYFHPQTSWMTREASVAVLIFPLALIGIFFNLQILTFLAGLLGLVFLYCQARILLAAKGIPSWRESTIFPLIMSTGLVEGTALLLLFTLSDSVPAWLLCSMLIFLAARTFFWISYRQKLHVQKAPEATLSILSSINKATLWAGNVVPFILVFIALLASGLSIFLISIAAILAVLSGWYMKFTIVTRAAQQQGFSLGKLQRGRPVIKPPVRRKPDKFVF